jgi:hypothetical protein
VICFVGVALYAWLASGADREEIAAEPALAEG